MWHFQRQRIYSMTTFYKKKILLLLLEVITTIHRQQSKEKQKEKGLRQLVLVKIMYILLTKAWYLDAIQTAHYLTSYIQV